MNIFKSLMYLGGLDTIDPRTEVRNDEFGPTYGNRIASRRAFGPPAHRGGNRPPAAQPQERVCAVGGCG